MGFEIRPDRARQFTAHSDPSYHLGHHLFVHLVLGDANTFKHTTLLTTGVDRCETGIAIRRGLSESISGGVFGGTIGAQIQQGHVVLGLEADLDWANIKGSGTFMPTIGGGLPLGTFGDKYRLGKHRKGPGGIC